jgi:NurA-like 5'-3' nuclease
MAECMLGSTKGYPYVLERAHTCSQIGNDEKKDFMKALSHDTSFKWICKVRR